MTITDKYTLRSHLVARGLRTSRKSTYGDRISRLSRRASAKRFSKERAASACMESGMLELGARLYASALHYYRRSEHLLASGRR